ncbi:MAG: hypothetical protein NTV49_02145 [Kiritimatiellaeota bacterium]|nr:hypothetical protein [Kiritimatiellota bacterium]
MSRKPNPAKIVAKLIHAVLRGLDAEKIARAPLREQLAALRTLAKLRPSLPALPPPEPPRFKSYADGPDLSRKPTL